MTSKTLAVSEWIQEDMKGNVEEKKKNLRKVIWLCPNYLKEDLHLTEL